MSQKGREIISFEGGLVHSPQSGTPAVLGWNGLSEVLSVFLQELKGKQ